VRAVPHAAGWVGERHVAPLDGSPLYAEIQGWLGVLAADRLGRPLRVPGIPAPAGRP